METLYVLIIASVLTVKEKTKLNASSTIKPHFESIPCNNEQSAFSAFEIQTVRRHDEDGESWFETVNSIEEIAEEDEDTICFGVYGRHDPAKNPDRFGGATHIVDRSTLEEARAFVELLNGRTIERIVKIA